MNKYNEPNRIVLSIPNGSENYYFFRASVEAYSKLLYGDVFAPPVIIDMMKELPLINFIKLTNSLFPAKEENHAASISLSRIHVRSLLSIVGTVSIILTMDEGEALKEWFTDSNIASDWDKIYLKKATKFFDEAKAEFSNEPNFNLFLERIMKI